MSTAFPVYAWAASACALSLLTVNWYTSRRPNLNSIPTIGYSSSVLSYINAVQFIFGAQKMVQEGYDKYKGGLFKVALMDHWEVVASGRDAIEDIRKASDDVLSLDKALERTLQSGYTLGPQISLNPYHIPIVRYNLTKNISQFSDDLHEEIHLAFSDLIVSKGSEWVPVPALDTIIQVVCRATSRVFVGLPLCRDQNYLKLTRRFTIDVIKAAHTINRFPDFLKPIAGRLLTNVPSSINRAMKHLKPIIDERRREMSELGDDWHHKPNDMLMWLMDAATGEEQSIRSLTRRVLAMNFAAIHTSSLSFTHALHHLAENEDYAQMLREEIEPIVAEDGWSKVALAKMRKLDSFLREAQRFEGLGILNMLRLVLKPFTFSNGSSVPPGATLSVAMRPAHFDEENYADAAVFNPLRFLDRTEDNELETRHQMVSTSTDFLAFGHGRHACPGRFFAVHELKTMLAEVVLNYDVRFEGGQMPSPYNIGNACVPGKGKLMFRKRQA